ncbi:MAG TPA: hypothetical protein VLE51_01035 [Candidatus Saccharimonadales bacterium]|nr:hypothetical protein [Candidatus Saccharimonadales bacterium]
MILLEDQPTLTDLHSLITKVPSYPITVKQLTDLALQKRAPKTVLDFYHAFPDDQVFEDKDDLLSRTDNVEMLQHHTGPVEEMYAAED